MTQKCEHHEICGLDIEADPEKGLCILHSKDPSKDRNAFQKALDKHRKKKGDDFQRIVFPGGDYFRFATFSKLANFSMATFTEETDFFRATFTEGANFNGARFTKGATFDRATFTKGATFDRATFTEGALFIEATFSKGADFRGATFTKGATFDRATFAEGADFRGATFLGGADFRATFFKGEGTVDFKFSSFQGRTLFTAHREEDRTVRIFSGVEVDFRQVAIHPLDALSFRDADLRKCRLLGTDLRKVELTDVTWHEIDGRPGVYDEDAPLKGNEERPWAHIERLYRELKQNHEDRRDYERASDFHYGEKEMRRRNPGTPGRIRLLLNLYCLVSGYGERFGRPLIWAGMLFVLCTFGYLLSGVGFSTLGEAAIYSFQVMTFLKPQSPALSGTAKVIYSIQSLLGPLFLGLFALAVRQRLKR